MGVAVTYLQWLCAQLGHVRKQGEWEYAPGRVMLFRCMCGERVLNSMDVTSTSSYGGQDIRFVRTSVWTS